MDRRIALICIPLLLFTTCKKEQFPEPERVFERWSAALRSLNYAEYRACEAYPKSEGSFIEIYRYTYYAQCLVRAIGDPNENRAGKDGSGYPYITRKVYFECHEVERKTGKQGQTLRGDVDFIKFKSGPRAGDGWLMWNRTIFRIDQ